jgi:ribosome-binding protein aMBF1 (putative translation factor)
MPAKRKTYDTMTGAIREAIAESELSFKALERETGVLRQSLMKFAAGEQTLRLDAADKLAEFFGIQVTPHKKGE